MKRQLFFIALLPMYALFSIEPAIDLDQQRVDQSNTKAADIAIHQQITAPISIGELIDKMTILQIKLKKIHDPKKLEHVYLELQLLDKVYKAHVTSNPELIGLIEQLRKINEKLWGIEDTLRVKESLQEFDSEFIEVARSVYFTNDERGRLKREINKLTGSILVEEKQYADY